MEAFEIGAEMLAHLCYPERDQTDKAAEVASGLCARFLKNAREEEPDNVLYAQDRWPQYKIRENRAINEKRLLARSGKALTAGSITLTYLKQFMGDEPLVLPEGVKHTVGNMLRSLEGRTSAEHSDMRRRVLKPWLPIAPLAASWRLYANAVKDRSVGIQLDDLNLHRAIAAKEREFATIMAKHDRMNWLQSDPLLIEWIEGVQNSAAIGM
ncbi:MAG: hypothetical protein JWO15_3274 [Sphingomonadales bacterium]|nr:hypothetical protein [Sphingomonadales bacterium]